MRCRCRFNHLSIYEKILALMNEPGWPLGAGMSHCICKFHSLKGLAMKLNKQQQQEWNTVTSIFSALSRTVTDPGALETEMSTWVSKFEAAMGNEVKVKIRMLPAPSIDLIDCSKDFLKLNRDESGYSILKARVEGISFSSTVAYKDQYRHGNGAVVDALRALADSLEKLPTEMRDLEESVDIYSLIGITHSAANGEDEPDEPTEEKAPDASQQADAEEDAALIELLGSGKSDAV